MSNDNRNNLLLFAIPFLATFLVYLKTVCPTVYTGDSGEFCFDIATLGIAHPPGYPLLLFLGKVFLTIFPGNVAYVLNVFSAVLASSATGIGAFVARNLIFPAGKRNDSKAIVISIFTAIAWGYSNALWAVAVGIEVYGLGACLILLSLLSLLRFHETHRQKYLIFSIYMFCLGLTNHLTIAAMTIPILYTMIKEKVSIRVWVWSVILFVITISAYLYLPLRSAHNPIADWDHPARFSSFFDHITAKRYHSFISGFWIGNYFENLWRSIRIATDQYPLWLDVLGIVAIMFTRRLARSVRLIIVAIILFNFLTVAIYDIPDIEQYYLPSFFLGTVGLTILAGWIIEKVLRRWREIAIISVLVVVASVTLALNFARNDQSRNMLGRVYGMDILNCVPQNALLISIADNSNSSIFYLHFIEGIRKDLEIYDPVKVYGLIKDRLGISRNDTTMTGQELCLKMLSENQNRAYIVKEHMLIKGTPIDYSAIKLIPEGLIYRLTGPPPNIDIWNKIEIPALKGLARQIDFKGITMMANLYLCRGEDLLALGDTARARDDFKTASEVSALSGEASVHNSLGVFFRRRHQTDLAEQEYSIALKSWHLTAFERANIYVNLGNLEKDGGSFEKATDYYNQALAINKNNKEANYNLSLATAYNDLNRGLFRDAAANFEKALTYSGADPRLIYNLGIIYDQKLGDRSKAIYYYRQFAEIAPLLPEGKAAQARAKELSGQ